MVAETGRLPVDNPSTHLELTMMHEAMVLEYAGPRPGAGRAGLGDAADRLARAAGQPVRCRGASPPPASPALLPSASAAFVVKVAALGAVLAAGEVFLAKLRLFRVPELLAGSFVLALLAVVAVLLPRLSR